MTKILTLDTVKQDAEAIINRDEFGPDYVYPHLGGCLYATNFAPSCLVGQILSHEGVTIEQLYQLDSGGMEGYDDQGEQYSGDAAIYDRGVQDYLKQEAHLEIPGEVVTYLTVLQDKQDRGETWGTALEAANAAV